MTHYNTIPFDPVAPGPSGGRRKRSWDESSCYSNNDEDCVETPPSKHFCCHPYEHHGCNYQKPVTTQPPHYKPVAPPAPHYQPAAPPAPYYNPVAPPAPQYKPPAAPTHHYYVNRKIDLLRLAYFDSGNMYYAVARSYLDFPLGLGLAFNANQANHVKYYVGDVIGNRYTLLSSLGQGAFGHVIEAYDARTNCMVAIKFAVGMPFGRESATSEINVLQKLLTIDPQGKNLWVRMFDSFFCDEHICIVMEICACSIKDFMRKNSFRPFPMEHIRHIIYQLCYSVKSLHEHGIVHTDLKPENILFVKANSTIRYSEKFGYFYMLDNTNIRVTDFGLATFIFEERSMRIQTRPYRSPEVIVGLPWDQSSDVWSIGCILFELYTGRYLFATEVDEDQLAMMEHTLGPLPKSYLEKSKLKIYLDAGIDYKEFIPDAKPLEEHMMSYTMDDIELFDLMRKMLAFKPASRITLQQALRHPFLMRVPPELSLF